MLINQRKKSEIATPRQLLRNFHVDDAMCARVVQSSPAVYIRDIASRLWRATLHVHARLCPRPVRRFGGGRTRARTCSPPTPRPYHASPTHPLILRRIISSFSLHVGQLSATFPFGQSERRYGQLVTSAGSLHTSHVLIIRITTSESSCSPSSAPATPSPLSLDPWLPWLPPLARPPPRRRS